MDRATGAGISDSGDRHCIEQSGTGGAASSECISYDADAEAFRDPA